MLTSLWSNRNSHLLLVGMQTGIATLEDKLVVSYKANYSLPMEAIKCTPRHLLK